MDKVLCEECGECGVSIDGDDAVSYFNWYESALRFMCSPCYKLFGGCQEGDDE